MKWQREGPVIHIQLEASDFPEPRPLPFKWDLPSGEVTTADGETVFTLPFAYRSDT